MERNRRMYPPHTVAAVSLFLSIFRYRSRDMSAQRRRLSARARRSLPAAQADYFWPEASELARSIRPNLAFVCCSRSRGYACLDYSLR